MNLGMPHRALVFATLLACSIFAEATAAADTCMDVVAARARAVLFDARTELNRHRALTDAFADFNTLQRRWNRVTHGADARRCLLARPDLLLAHQRLLDRGRPVIAQIRRRRDQLCNLIGPVLLGRYTEYIDTALARGQLLFARAQADKLARALNSDQVFTGCPSLRRRIAWVRDDYLPRVRVHLSISGTATVLFAAIDAQRRTLATARSSRR